MNNETNNAIIYVEKKDLHCLNVGMLSTDENFIKILKLVNKSNFKRASIFHIHFCKPDEYSWQRMKEIYLEHLSMDLNYTCSPTNTEVLQSYEEFKIQRDILIKNIQESEFVSVDEKLNRFYGAR